MCRGIVVVPLHLRREKPILVALACAQHAETEAAPAACASFLSLSHTYTLSLSHILIHRSVRRQLSLALSLILSLSHTLWTVDCGVWCFSIASRSPAAATTAAATHTHTHTHTYTHTHTHTQHTTVPACRHLQVKARRLQPPHVNCSPAQSHSLLPDSSVQCINRVIMRGQIFSKWDLLGIGPSAV